MFVCLMISFDSFSGKSNLKYVIGSASPAGMFIKRGTTANSLFLSGSGEYVLTQGAAMVSNGYDVINGVSIFTSSTNLRAF